MKDAKMRIRVEPQLQEAFVSACRGQDFNKEQTNAHYFDVLRHHHSAVFY